MIGSVVALSGTVLRSPELVTTSTGHNMTAFPVKVRRDWVGPDGSRQSEHSTCEVIVWADMAVNVVDTLVKGDRVCVIGVLQSRKLERDDGTVEHRLAVVADDIGPSMRWAAYDKLEDDEDDDGR